MTFNVFVGSIFLGIIITGCEANKITEDITLDYPQVQTTSGLVTGATTVESNAFWEIPYAQPPLGNLRYQAPKPITTPNNEINGTNNNFLQCYQYEEACAFVSENRCRLNMKEDCLILNVFTPASMNLKNATKPPSERLPVLFYIHGGFFIINSATQPRHDGRELANVTGTVVVTINYRLGPFGFLSHQETGQDDIKGNQGLKDQQLAMRWVQDNIANFGGDKTKVTIFGNSAGAQSVMFHTLSNISKNLYTNSIQQSNPAIASFYYPSPEMSLRITNRLLQSLGCTGDERACLLNSTPQTIVNQTTQVQNSTQHQEGNWLYSIETYLPVIDGVEFKDLPMNLYKSGKWNSDKDMIIGVTTEEQANDAYLYPKDFSFDEKVFLDMNTNIFADKEISSIVVNKYKEIYFTNYADFRATFSKEMTEYIFHCPSRLMARLASQTTSASVYYYVFDEKILSGKCVEYNSGNKTGCYFAFHATEIEFIFRTFDDVRPDNYTEKHLSVENQFSTYWGSFVRTGNPSSGLNNSVGSFPSWPKYKFSNDRNQSWLYMYIHSPSGEVRQGFQDEICDFWDSSNYGQLDHAMSTATETAIYTTTEEQSTTSHAMHPIQRSSVTVTALLFGTLVCVLTQC
ncbi:crystal protein-like [Styela clava]